MRLLFTFSLFGVLFSLGCSTHNDLAKTGLNTKERHKLNEIVLNHEFYSGCVTEEIADLQAVFCETTNQCPKSDTETEESVKAFTDQLDYQAWLKIYKACIANTF